MSGEQCWGPSCPSPTLFVGLHSQLSTGLSARSVCWQTHPHLSRICYLIFHSFPLNGERSCHRHMFMAHPYVYLHVCLVNVLYAGMEKKYLNVLLKTEVTYLQLVTHGSTLRRTSTLYSQNIKTSTGIYADVCSSFLDSCWSLIFSAICAAVARLWYQSRQETLCSPHVSVVVFPRTTFGSYWPLHTGNTPQDLLF